jgi:hypothetical protein
MALILASIVINGIVSLSVLSSREYPEGLGWFLLLFVAVSLSGAALIASGQKRWGSWLSLVGCVVFVPIGFLGVVGARQIMDALHREEFEARRARSNKGGT